MKRNALIAAQAGMTVLLLALLLRGFDWVAFRLLFARIPGWF